jgi:anthranilate/para-aminobenzoate synthase component II
MGIVEMEPTTDNFIFGGRKSFNVRENHRWVVRSIKDPLEEIGRSKDGIEAVKHKSKEIWGFQFHPETYVEGNEGYLIFDRLIEYFNKKNN